MIKQIIFPILGVIAFIVIVGMFFKKTPLLNLNVSLPTVTQPTPSGKTLTIGSKSVNVEVANTEKLRKAGLSGKSSLAQDSGMLFVFDSLQVTPEFWMKGMLIPIDMIWISQGKVVKIDANVQPPSPGTPDSNLTIYAPNGKVDYVLEVNGGFSDKNGIKTGAAVTLPTL